MAKRKNKNLFTKEERKMLLELIFIVLLMVYVSCIIADIAIPNYNFPSPLHGIIIGIIGFLIYQRWNGN